MDRRMEHWTPLSHLAKAGATKIIFELSSILPLTWSYAHLNLFCLQTQLFSFFALQVLMSLKINDKYSILWVFQ